MMTRLCLSMLYEPGSDPEVEQWFNELRESAETRDIINTPTKAGYSAIYYAVKMADVSVVKKLFALGANLSGQYDGLTLRDIVQQELTRGQGPDSKEDPIYAQYQEIDQFLAEHDIFFDDELLNKFKKDYTKYNWATSLMKKKEYKDASEGYCFGIANMGAQAFLLQNRDAEGNLIHLNHFANRIKYLEKSHDVDLAIEISHHRNILLTELAKSNLENKEEKKSSKEMLAENSYQAPDLSDEDKINLEIDPFLNGLELFQQMKNYPHLSENKVHDQSPTPAFRLVPNIALEEQGGAVIVDQFIGDYSKEEDLRMLLSKIKEFATGPDPESLRYKNPVVLQLNANGHAITVGYDPIQKQWHYIDANFPEKIAIGYPDIETITKNIIVGLKTSLKANDLLLEVNILSTAAHAREMKEKIIKPLHHSKAWKNQGFFVQYKKEMIMSAIASSASVGFFTVSAFTGGFPAILLGAMSAIIGIGNPLFAGMDFFSDKRKAHEIKQHLEISIKKYEQRMIKEEKFPKNNHAPFQSSTGKLYSHSFELVEVDEKKLSKKKPENKATNDSNFTEPQLQQEDESVPQLKRKKIL